MAADQSSPSPGSGGPSLTRRNFLKTTAGAATAGAILAADGPLDVESPVGDADAIAVTTAVAAGVLAGSSSGLLFGSTLRDYEDALDANINRSVAIAHEASVSEMESYGQIELMVDNDLETTNTMAHMEARHAIASAWESGKSSGDAYNDALDAIERYYGERVENNWIMATAKSATQHAYCRTAAIEAIVDDGGERDIDSDAGAWGLGVFEHPDYGTNSWSELLEDRTQREMELQDGSSIEVPWPDVLVEWDGDGVSETINLLDLLRGYDEDEEDFGVDIDGERVSWSGKINIPTWSYEDDDGEEESLKAYLGLDFDEQYRSIRTEIEDQKATVVGNYDEGLVEDLYVRLDDGDITPSDIRGIDAQALFMSGTSDATADSYRMALLQALDMEEPDLSETASMSITYTGWTDPKYIRDDTGEVYFTLGDKVTDQEYEGLLWAKNAPNGGLNTDGTYLADPIVFTDAEKRVHAVGSSSGSSLWETSEFDNNVTGLAVSPSAETVVASLNTGDVKAFEVPTGEEMWSESVGGASSAIAFSPDGETVFATSDDPAVLALDAKNGSEEWSKSWGEPVGLAVSPDGDQLYLVNDEFATNDAATIQAIDTSDGSEVWKEDVTNGVNSVVASTTGEVYTTDSSEGEVQSFKSDGTHRWTESLTDAENVATSSSGSEIYVIAGETVHVLDSEDGSEATTYSSEYGELFDIHADVTDTIHLSTGDEIFALNDGSEVYHSDLSGSWVASSYGCEVRPDLAAGGAAYGATMYDAENSDEIDLRNGIFTVDAMSNQDGKEIDETGEWSDPDYDQIDLDSWTDYLDEAEEFRETVEQYTDETTAGGGGTIGGDDLLDGLPSLPDWIPGSGLVQWAIVGVGTLVGINVLTD